MKRQKICSIHHVEKRDGNSESLHEKVERVEQLIGSVITVPRIAFYDY
jgi:hypothetical protein